MPLPLIEPPLVNSSNPWATGEEDLQRLFDCPFTGAVTSRTSLLHGFEHDPETHQYAFFNPENNASKSSTQQGQHVSSTFGGSLNTLGYSPLDLDAYLAMIRSVVNNSKACQDSRSQKPFIISVTGTSEEVAECYRRIQHCQSLMSNPLCMEVNLSCPNILGKPPPAYSKESLAEYLKTLADERRSSKQERVAIGIKTPPYTFHDQFKTLVDALTGTHTGECPIDFITATNTLGSCLLLDPEHMSPVLDSSSGTGIGGLAGTPLHPLALGNVKTIRSLFEQHESLKDVDIIGVGGVSDRAGFNRMRAVGANVVAVGTALGREGVSIFEKIWRK